MKMKLNVLLLILCFNTSSIENTNICQDNVNNPTTDNIASQSATTGSNDDNRKEYSKNFNTKSPRLKREASKDSDDIEKDNIVRADNSEQGTHVTVSLSDAKSTETTETDPGVEATTSSNSGGFGLKFGMKSFGFETDDKDKGKQKESITTLTTEIQTTTKSPSAKIDENPKHSSKLIPMKLPGRFAFGKSNSKDKKNAKGKQSKGNDDGDKMLKLYMGGDENQSEDEQKKTDKFYNSYKNKFGSRCWKDIGCFSAVTEDFTTHVIPVLPMSPDAISPVFHLYTVEERTEPVKFSYNPKPGELKNTTFNPKLRTAFIIHGFQSSYALWMEHMKDFLFLQSNDAFNVFVVVWDKGSKVPSYSLAATNTRVVGALVAFFIEQICQTFNIKNDQFWLIGHSLGAQTSGYAGKRLYNPKLARITGLDPAGVSFNFKNAELRLHPKDATIVDVIHTDSAFTFREGFGTFHNLGHYDFYPNGGIWQPGCPKSMGLIHKFNTITVGDDITCSHSRACILTTNLDKPNDNCNAIGYQCESYETFLEGRCADCRDGRCQPMGLNPNYWLNYEPNHKGNRTFYINTQAHEPFCINHYQIGLHISKDSDSTTGYLYFTLQTQVDNKMEEISFKRIMTKTVPKKLQTLLVTFDYRLSLSSETKMFINWKTYNNEKNRFNRGYRFKITVIELNYMSHMNASFKEKYSIKFCPLDGPDTTIYRNKPRKEYIPCEPELERSVRTTDTCELIPLTARQDIYSVDYLDRYPIFQRIPSSYFRSG